MYNTRCAGNALDHTFSKQKGAKKGAPVHFVHKINIQGAFKKGYLEHDKIIKSISSVNPYPGYTNKYCLKKLYLEHED
jgi:hypothetical protein